MNNSGTLNYVYYRIILFAHVRAGSTRQLSMNKDNNRTSKREEGEREDILQKFLHLGTNWLNSSKESGLWAPELSREIHDTFRCLRSLWKTLRVSVEQICHTAWMFGGPPTSTWGHHNHHGVSSIHCIKAAHSIHRSNSALCSDAGWRGRCVYADSDVRVKLSSQKAGNQYITSKTEKSRTSSVSILYSETL